MFQSFGSVEEMFDAIEQSRRAADGNTKPWQKQIKPGDKVLRISQDLCIYCEVLQPSEGIDDAEEAESALQDYAEPHMVCYRFSRCFSSICPHGELGDLHVSTVICTLTDEQFETARQLGWPSEPAKALELLGSVEYQNYLD